MIPATRNAVLKMRAAIPLVQAALSERTRQHFEVARQAMGEVSQALGALPVGARDEEALQRAYEEFRPWATRFDQLAKEVPPMPPRDAGARARAVESSR